MVPGFMCKFWRQDLCANQGINPQLFVGRHHKWSGQSKGQMGHHYTANKPRGTKNLRSSNPNKSLLAKLIVRGLTPGLEPWKILLRHRLETTRAKHYGTWHPSAHWIMDNKPVITTGSQLWKSTFTAWQSIMSSLTPLAPQHRDEILREPLYGNPRLVDVEGRTWGSDKDDRLINWSHKVVHTLNDIWDEEKGSWNSSVGQSNFIPATS